MISGAVGVAKPDRAIYELLCSRNSIAPSEAVFFDDSLINVEGARMVGMHSELFTSAAQARRDLARLGILGDPPTAPADMQ